MNDETYTYVTREGPLPEDLLRAVSQFFQLLFEGFDEPSFRERLRQVTRSVLVAAYRGDELVGCKLGYARSESVFYSWLGGVSAAHRQRGIARELMRRQHDWCRRQGFTRVRMKTRNRWRSMLLLSLQEGFYITETYTRADNDLRIILEKAL